MNLINNKNKEKRCIDIEKEEELDLHKPPSFITIGAGMLGGGFIGFFTLDINGLILGILMGFIIGILFYVHDRI